MRFAHVIVIASLVVACSKPAAKHPVTEPDVPPALPLPVESDVGLTSPLGKMCAHLRELHCPEGEPIAANGERRTCYQTMSQAQHNAPIDVACVTQAKDPVAVRACGNPKLNVVVRCELK